MCCTIKFFLLGFSCVGLGARLVVESQGRGASCVGAPRVKYSGYTSNGHLFLSTFCAGGGQCDIWCVCGPPFNLWGWFGFLGHYQNMTRHALS